MEDQKQSPLTDPPAVRELLIALKWAWIFILVGTIGIGGPIALAIWIAMHPPWTWF